MVFERVYRWLIRLDGCDVDVVGRIRRNRTTAGGAEDEDEEDETDDNYEDEDDDVESFGWSNFDSDRSDSSMGMADDREHGS